MIPFLKFAVIFMGILIVAGLVVIGIKIMQKSDNVSEAVNSFVEDDNGVSDTDMKIKNLIANAGKFKVQMNDFQKGASWQLHNIISENDRLILHFKSIEGLDNVVIVSLADGSIVGKIHIVNQGQ